MINSFEETHTPKELEENTRDFGILLKNFGLSDLQIAKLSTKTTQFFTKGNSYAEVASRVARIVAEINPKNQPLSLQKKQELYQGVDVVLE